MKRKMVVGSADLSQVEGRVELMLAAGTPEFYGTDVGKECVRIAQAHPADFDMHRYSGSVTFDKSEASVSADERQDGKNFMYGFQRGMGAQKLVDEMLKKRGVVVTVEEAERRLGRLKARLPAIPEGYFLDVQRQAMRFRGLGTTWGGIWRCDWQKLEEPLYAKGYSYQPVRETVDLINQRGFLPLYEAIRKKALAVTKPVVVHQPPVPIEWWRIPRMHVHGHDSLTWSVYPDDAYMVFKFLESYLGGTVRHYYAGALQVPVTYSLGPTWKPSHEWKRLPDEKTVREAAWACAEA